METKKKGGLSPALRHPWLSQCLNTNQFLFILNNNFRIRILRRHWQASFFQEIYMLNHPPFCFIYTILNRMPYPCKRWTPLVGQFDS